MAVSMIGVGVCTALAAVFGSTVVVVALFGRSGVFIGPFGAALFLARTQQADESVRTQVFTIGAGLKVTASAVGAALIGLAAPRPGSVQLLLAAGSPLLAGGVAIGALLLWDLPAGAVLKWCVIRCTITFGSHRGWSGSRLLCQHSRAMPLPHAGSRNW